MKKKLIALALAAALIGVSVVSGTLAYLTDSEEATNVFTVGNVEIELTDDIKVVDAKNNDITATHFNEADNTFTNIVPTNYIQKKVTVKNTGDTDAYVRIAVVINNHKSITYALTESSLKPATVDEVFSGWSLKFEDGYAFKSIGYNVERYDASKIEASEIIPSVDTILSTNNDEVGWTYYFKLDAGESVQIFEGIASYALFNTEENNMFKNMKIEIYADAIQAEGFIVTEDEAAEKTADEVNAIIVTKAFEALEGAHPLAQMRTPAPAESTAADSSAN